MSERVPMTEILAEALEAAHAPEAMIDAARRGLYDDFKSPYATPITILIITAQKNGLADIADRAMGGEFDAPKWEGDAWARSPDGAKASAIFFGCTRTPGKGKRR